MLAQRHRTNDASRNLPPKKAFGDPLFTKASIPAPKHPKTIVSATVVRTSPRGSGRARGPPPRGALHAARRRIAARDIETDNIPRLRHAFLSGAVRAKRREIAPTRVYCAGFIAGARYAPRCFIHALRRWSGATTGSVEKKQ